MDDVGTKEPTTQREKEILVELPGLKILIELRNSWVKLFN